MTPRPEPIALIGSGCRFPGGCNTPSKLWELLRQPRDLLKKVPKTRFDIDAFYHPDPTHHGTTDVKHSYFLDEDPAEFDAQLFGIQPMESDSIDPQQRLLLETVYDSLEAAGLPMEALRGSSTAVYVGMMCDDWSGILTKDWDSFPTYTATGMARSIISNRISYVFDWHGPSMTIDTACSSSLVAVHEAVRTLRSGESKVAIAAGANLILSPGMYIAESKLRMLSPTGRSRMWDASADGYARGEGIAAVVLKTLSQAIADGDHIECIIRETGVNQDGKTSGLTMPSNLAQTALIRDTYARAGLDLANPDDRPQLFHAHGTGTKAGDPQEAEAISQAFFHTGLKDAFANEKLYVGSIKTIIGHTEGTAGLASLIGSSLAIQHSVIPPNMHFNTLNPELLPFYGHLEVPTSAKQWPALAPGQLRRASINSFGFGGTNAHAIIENYVPEKGELAIRNNAMLFTPLTFSANSEKSLAATLADYLEFLTASPAISLRDLAWTLQHRRSTLSYRKAISGMNLDAIRAKLAAALNDDKKSSGPSDKVSNPRILGVFTGQGAQWPRMGAELFQTSTFVQDRIAELDSFLSSLPEPDRPSWSIQGELLAPAASSRTSEAAISQPLCTAVQILLVDLLKAAGIEFHAVVGHSSGEIGAAYSAGLMTAKDAIRVAYYRGVHAKLAASPNNGAKGAMMAVGTSPEDATSFCELEGFQGRIQVAALNSSSSITLSGDDEAIEEAVEIFKDEQKFARRLKVDTAYHSSHMLSCSGPYLDSMRQCGVKPLDGNAMKWYSSVIDGAVMSQDLLSEQYWVDNMTNPVLFSSAITKAAEQAGPFDLVIEVGPHPALKGPALGNLSEAGINAPYTGVLARGQNDAEELSSALGVIWTILGSGSVNFDNFERLVSGSTEQRQLLTDLPGYAFDHQRTFWTESRVSGAYKQARSPPHPILGSISVEGTSSTETVWRNLLRVREISWLQGHKLQGQVVFPATGYVAMAVEALNIIAKERGVNVSLYKIANITINRAIAFNDDNSSVESLFRVRVVSSDEHHISAEFVCESCPAGENSMAVNAQGRVELNLGDMSSDTLPQSKPSNLFNLVDVEVNRFYHALHKVGYEYSHPFHGISNIKRKIDFAVGHIEDQSGSAWEDQLIVHPGMLDTALQTIFAAFCSPGDERLWSLHVPVKVEAFVINPVFSTAGARKHIVLPYEASIRDNQVASGIVADAELHSDDGHHTFVRIEGVSLAPFSPAQPENDAVLFSSFQYQLAGPSGVLAAMGERPSDYEIKMAKDLERVSYFYLRRLSETIPSRDREHTLLHYKRLLNWADHVVGLVGRGEHPFVTNECRKDTHNDIVKIIDKYRERVDVRLIESVGENLPHVIKEGSNILEHMTKDDILSRFYEDGLGLAASNRWISRMVKQICHRYPHMNILEIGAGTGGSTRIILPAIGSAFSTYTYTDISSAFFEAAEERFKEYADRMVFKTLDMERDPLDQGFIRGSYDLIIASNVLHATDKLKEMMTNVRTLLKPGGYLVNLEVVNNDPLRNGLPMGGLPGWWIGAESGRPWGPTLTLSQWDDLVTTCGFTGIETATPDYDELHPFSVWAAMAADDRINILREPLALLPSATAEERPELTIVGGKSLRTFGLVEQLVTLLSTKFSRVQRVPSVESLVSNPVPAGSTILGLTELDEPLLRTVTEAKLEGLKSMWGLGRNILWVTCGSRAEEPHSFMMVGIGRAMRFEYPNINLQTLDFDTIDSTAITTIAETLLRLQLLDTWQREKPLTDLMWSSEPEIVIENGKTFIPRLYPNREQNQRHNSRRRPIWDNVDPQQSVVRLALGNNGRSLELQRISPLRAETSLPQGVLVLRISQSLLQSVAVGAVGHLTLFVGVEETTGSAYLALADAAESPVRVAADCAILLPSQSADFGLMALQSTAAYLIANHVLSLLPRDSNVLIHDADRSLRETILGGAKKAGVKPLFTSSDPSQKGEAKFIPPNTSLRELKQQVLGRAVVASFVDFSNSDGPSSKMARLIHDILPAHCQVFPVTTFLANEVATRPGSVASSAGDVLRAAWNDANSASGICVESTDPIPLSSLSDHATFDQRLAIVDWTVSSAPARVLAVDNDTIFHPNKTYLMVGLSGEVGQSLCEWMVRHGARYIVLTSRKPKVDPEFVKNLEGYGATIRTMSLDITSRDSLQRCYDEISRTLPPIGGVANGAMVLQDILFQKMDLEALTKVLRPKVEGSKLLDEFFHDTPLEFFIMFSSITAVVGNSGQSNYIAANMFMTALAFQRRKRGVSGSVMDISSLVGIGYVERSDNFDAEYFANIGYTNISEQDLHQMFAEAILVGRPDSTESAEIVTGFAPAYADKEIKAQYRSDLKFCHFILERPGAQGSYAGNNSAVPVRIQLEGIKRRDEAFEVIKTSFETRLRKILQIPEDEPVNDKVALVEQGVDSLVAVEVRSWFLKEIDIDMPVLKVLGGNSIIDLLNDAMERIPASILHLDAPNADEPVSRPKLPISKSSELSLHTISSKRSHGATESGSGSGQTTPPSSISEETIGSVPESPKEKTTFKDVSWRDAIIQSSSEVTETMSFGQTRFWFLNHALQDKTAFNMAFSVRLEGSIRVSALEQAVDVVARRHEALRTRYFWSGDNLETPTQGVLSTPLMRLETRRVSQESQVKEELNAIQSQTWDLNDWESMKIALLSLDDATHWFIVAAHHISLDGISFQIFFADLEKAYKGLHLPPLPVESQYRSFAVQQRREYESGRMRGDIEYYQKMIPEPMVEAIPLFSFSKLRARKILDQYGEHRADIRLQSNVTTKIKQLARKNHSTSFHVYLAALQILLFRLLPEVDSLFIGIADANRTDKKFMHSIGFFLNLLPIRFDRPTTGFMFGQAVKEARNKSFAALEHSALPFDVLLNALNITRPADATPIFQVLMDYRQGVQERTTFADCKAEGESNWHIAKSGYDVALDVIENPAGDSLLTLKLQQSLYSPEHTDLLLNTYVHLLEAFTSSLSLDVPLDGPPLWPEIEVKKAIETGFGESMVQEWPETVSHRIDDIIRESPHRPAIKDGRGNALTYQDLKRRVQAIASRILEEGECYNKIIGVFQEPASDWICSLLAVLRVGATYLPLDTRQSIPRLASVIEQTKPVFILNDLTTSEKTKLLAVDRNTQFINVSNVSSSHSPATLSATPNLAKSSSPAVVLFTSGSTGTPKGIVLRHSSLRAQSEAFSRTYNLPKIATKVLQQTAYSFDIAMEQILTALCNGGCLYVVPAEHRGDPLETTNLMATEGIDYTAGTPSEYDMWLQFAPDNLRRCLSWGTAVAGGEKLSDALVEQFRLLNLPGFRLVNNYGPAEITVACTKGEVAYRNVNLEKPVPTGFTLPNFSVYILDKSGAPLPIGVPGEIAIGGCGVAAGYFGLDELTRKRFVSDPFANQNRHFASNGWTTMYLTGDRGRLRRDGALYCDGRIDGDTQIKLRGIRMELGDIENAILQASNDALSHAVVTVRRESDTAPAFLAAHVVFSPQYSEPDRQRFLAKLAASLPLPDYMIPSVMVPLDSLPVTSHIKTDRKAIAALELPASATSNLDSAPLRDLTSTETALVNLWREAVPESAAARGIDVKTDFFHVGGTSMLLVKLQSLIKREFRVAPRLIDLMGASTLKAMALAVEAATAGGQINWAEETAVPAAWATFVGSRPQVRRGSGLRMLVTGATGYLGRRVVRQLTALDAVEKIYCLVRDGRESARVAVLPSSAKVSVIACNFPQPGLGLCPEDMSRLSNNADVILHCAANRNFWDDYEVLRPVNLEAVKELVRLALPRLIPIHFLSSGRVTIYKDNTPPVNGSDGYVASKWAAEEFLGKVAAQTGLPVVIHRPIGISDGGLSSSEQSQAQAQQVVKELTGLVRAMKLSPDFGGVTGTVDILPAQKVVEDVVAAVVSGWGDERGVVMVEHAGQIRADFDAFAQEVEWDEELKGLERVPALQWIGKAKENGFEQFLASHRLVISSETKPYQSLLQCLYNSVSPFLIPTDPGWPAYGTIFSEWLQYIPATITLPSTTDQIATVVNYVGRYGIPIRAKSGGPLVRFVQHRRSQPDLDGPPREFQLGLPDNRAGVAAVGGGVRPGNLARGVWVQGRQALGHGSCPGVGIGWHFTRGRYGDSSRAFGLALEQIVALDVVLANGSFMRVVDDTLGDVYYALRGATDSFDGNLPLDQIFSQRGIQFLEGLNDAMANATHWLYSAYLNYIDPELDCDEARHLYYGEPLF
ncbi:Nonribosomal peptide synthetase 14 [Triangularia setosa]|uniref:Nonribosomal peptide synthetase 14 n=1 Tax=Triangularia setosa TaxID=2587417 RepID=A0AAN7A7H1_9PEZI|nr:Nonribosomal peptide synthetase 14 [Podospora setosa]